MKLFQKSINISTYLIYNMKGAFYRFQFMLLTTILCAVITIVSYYLSQLYETYWVWDTEKPAKIQYSGAFITGKRKSMLIQVFFIIFIYRSLWYAEYICFCYFGTFLTSNLKCR